MTGKVNPLMLVYCIGCSLNCCIAIRERHEGQNGGDTLGNIT
jgi:hypothetical protein